MKKVLALVLSLLLLVSAAFAEEVVSASISENVIATTDSDKVVIVENSDVVKALVEEIAVTENLAEMLTDETVVAVVEALGEAVVVDDVVEVDVQNYTEEDGVITVTFVLESKFDEGEKAELVFIGFNEAGEKIYEICVEAVANAEGDLVAVMEPEVLNAIQADAAHTAMVVMTAAK